MADFWTRRRQAVAAAEREAAEREAARLAAAPELDGPADDTAAPAVDEAELLQQLGLPDPDSLSAGDDFTAFLRREVPEFLRRRALRSLWRSNPVLANLDGLLDHGEDFTDAATVVPGMKTAYQVGRGMTGHVEALARTASNLAHAPEAGVVAEPLVEPNPVRLPETAPGSRPEPIAPLPDLQAKAESQLDSSAAPDEGHLVTAESVEDDENDRHLPPPAPHMQFTFSGGAA